MTDEELMERAKKASERSYSPYSHFAVGAALECADGTVFTGCNVENAAYGECICAERTAVVKAVSEGYRNFVRLAVWADVPGVCTPCGSCRQVLAELAPGITVLCGGRGGISGKPLKELLPAAFDL